MTYIVMAYTIIRYIATIYILDGLHSYGLDSRWHIIVHAYMVMVYIAHIAMVYMVIALPKDRTSTST